MTTSTESIKDDQKSSDEILDGLFRELEEKSAKGELPAQSDFSAVLGNTLTNSDDVQHKSVHKKRKGSKHKHAHKHKKRKHRRSDSSDEWVPADIKKSQTEIESLDSQQSFQQSKSQHQYEIVKNTLLPLTYSNSHEIAFEKDITIKEIDVNNSVGPTENANACASDRAPQASMSFQISNEQVLFVPRVTRLDRKMFKRPLVTPQDDCLGSSPNGKLSAGDESTGAIEEKSSTAEESASGKEKALNDVDVKKPAEADGSAEKCEAAIPIENNLEIRHIAKLKSEITCSNSKNIAKSHTSKVKMKTKRKKRIHIGKGDLSIEQSPQCTSRDKKHKLKKHSKSKKISSRSISQSPSLPTPGKSSSGSRAVTRKSHSRSPKLHAESVPSSKLILSKSRQSGSSSRKSKSKTRGESRSSSRNIKQSKRASSPSNSSWSRDRSKSRSSILGEKIDKVKLLEIARKNALAMMAEGKLPVPISVSLEKPIQEKSAPTPFKAGGKSVEELTDFCKQLVKKDKEEGELSPDDPNGKPNHSSDEEDKGTPFVHHHPFKLREQPSIIMNIRNAVQIPIKTPAEKVAEGSKLRIQFPVSSGTQHRKKEWVPVSPKKEQPEIVKEKAVVKVEEVIVFQPPPTENTVDIGAIVSQRLKAVRKLMDNPHDVEALNQMYKSQQQMQFWAQSKQLPGQFTGTTDVQLLTPEQLAGPAHLQAWVKKDQFNRAAPVQGGFGMYMLQKMGWKPGEGLGKNKEGTAEPIIVDIKTDKKGLVSQGEIARKSAPMAKDLSGKHPVSALVELCNKRRWLPPEFILVHDSGPDHKKNFVFKVRVNGQDFQPTIASLNKKHAKAQAATVCLQALGLVPRDLNNPL